MPRSIIAVTTDVPLQQQPAAASPPVAEQRPTDRRVNWSIQAVEYAIAASLLILCAVVLVRTMITFLRDVGGYPASITNALDGVLVVIILVDILRTVVGLLHRNELPLRPFLEIAVLAAVRDILSASAHLTLGRPTNPDFNNALVELGVGVAVVIGLLFGLWLLRQSRHDS